MNTKNWLPNAMPKGSYTGLEIDRTVERLKTALSKCWDAQTREFLRSQLIEAEMLGLREKPDMRELARIEERAAVYLGDGLREAARRPVIEANGEAYAIGRRSAGIDLALKQPDMNALDIMADQSLSWIHDSYGNTVSEDLNRSIREYFEQGATRIQMIERLEELMSREEHPKMMGYFDLLADHITTRIGELGQVSGYEEAGIEYIEVVAVLDERTTEICRHMHGRVIPVSVLSRQRDMILGAAKNHDLDAMKRAQPMLSGDRAAIILSRNKTTDITDKGVALPPYHFRCRTTTVARFEPADYHEKVSEWAINGEIPDREQARLIQYAGNAGWGTHQVIWPKSGGGDGEPHPTSFVHYKKHASDVRAASMSDYNAKAMNLIGGGSRDVYAAIFDKKHPYPVLFFHNPKTRELVVVNVKGQNIVTYHIINDKQWENKLRSQDVRVKLKGGLTKWASAIFSKK